MSKKEPMIELTDEMMMNWDGALLIVSTELTAKLVGGTDKPQFPQVHNAVLTLLRGTLQDIAGMGAYFERIN